MNKQFCYYVDNKVDYAAFCFQYETKIISFAVMKFAYLITSYNNFHLLSNIVSMLDDERNDIFIHFDSKVRELPILQTKYSGLYIISKRVDVRWGTVSQIDSYFELYREAFNHGPYDFYHQISGTTLPLKSQDEIHAHFEKVKGASVFRFWDTDDADFKVRRIHFWIDNFQSRKPFVRWYIQRQWTLNMFIQKRLGIRINRKEQLYKTDSWGALSQKGIEYLLANEKAIKKRYRFSLAGDEYYMASELKKDSRQTVVDDPYLLYVDFELDHPRMLGQKDYESLKDSKYLFARKFDDSINVQ